MRFPASRIENRLETVSRQLGEFSNRRTEPDAIVDFADEGVMFIEAKLSRANDQLKPEHPNWDRYLGEGFGDCATVRTTGLYELTRACVRTRRRGMSSANDVVFIACNGVRKKTTYNKDP
jgi:hypothetical protein